MSRILLVLGLVGAGVVAVVSSGYAFIVFQLDHCFVPGEGSGALLEPPQTQSLVCGSDNSLESVSFLLLVVAALLGAGLVWLVWRNTTGRVARAAAVALPVLVPLVAFGLLTVAT